MNKNRLESFSDSVFSVAITLLIFNVKIPEAYSISTPQLHKVLVTSVPRLIAFGFSFISIGIFWVAHHRIFAFAKVVDSRLVWINIVYLMFVAVIPFPAGLLAENAYASVTIIIFSTTLFVISLMQFIMLEYIINNEHTRHEALTRDVHRSAQKTAIVGPVCYLLAGLLSGVNAYLSYGIIILAMIYYIFFTGKNKVSQELLAKSKREAEAENHS